MKLDFTIPGTIQVNMIDYIAGLLESSLRYEGKFPILALSYQFLVSKADSELFNETTSVIFLYNFAKLLFLCKIVHFCIPGLLSSTLASIAQSSWVLVLM
jgi:hypothetical protein